MYQHICKNCGKPFETYLKTSKYCCNKCRYEGLNTSFCLDGKTFGKLTVIKKVGVHKTRKQNLWLCKCECGNEVVRATSDLKSNKVPNCGCLLSKKNSETIKNNDKIKKFREKNFVENTSLYAIKSQKPLSNNKLGVRGVIYNKRAKSYHAYIEVQHKKTSLGYFKNLDDAIKARKEAEEKYFKPILDKYERGCKKSPTKNE